MYFIAKIAKEEPIACLICPDSAIKKRGIYNMSKLKVGKGENLTKNKLFTNKETETIKNVSA